MEILQTHFELVKDPSLIPGIKKTIESLTQSMNEKKDEIERIEEDLETLFDDMDGDPYELYAVFIHMGDVDSGHYYLYMKDMQLDRWIMYNDDIVKVVPESEIFSDTSGTKSNAYLLIYIQDANLVQCLTSDSPLLEQYKAMLNLSV